VVARLAEEPLGGRGEGWLVEEIRRGVHRCHLVDALDTHDPQP
jgi:plasmid stabilization system protein ParE